MLDSAKEKQVENAVVATTVSSILMESIVILNPVATGVIINLPVVVVVI